MQFSYASLSLLPVALSMPWIASRIGAASLGSKDYLLSFAADHGRESRHPFLDEDFVETILDLPLSLVADLEKPGEPFILAHLIHMGPSRLICQSQGIRSSWFKACERALQDMIDILHSDLE